MRATGLFSEIERRVKNIPARIPTANIAPIKRIFNKPRFLSIINRNISVNLQFIGCLFSKDSDVKLVVMKKSGGVNFRVWDEGRAKRSITLILGFLIERVFLLHLLQNSI